MPTYDPITADVTVDATIGAVTYIVTAFTDNGASSVGPDFSASDGSYRNTRQVSGPREASMTIEVENAAEATPTQYATLTYKGINWFIKTVGRASSSTGAATIPLTLRQVQPVV